MGKYLCVLSIRQLLKQAVERNQPASFTRVSKIPANGHWPWPWAPSRGVSFQPYNNSVTQAGLCPLQRQANWGPERALTPSRGRAARGRVCLPPGSTPSVRSTIQRRATGWDRGQRTGGNHNGPHASGHSNPSRVVDYGHWQQLWKATETTLLYRGHRVRPEKVSNFHWTQTQSHQCQAYVLSIKPHHRTMTQVLPIET